MGAKNGCEYKSCGNKAVIVCSCSGTRLCGQCIEPHKKADLLSSHEAMPILGQPGRSEITSDSLVRLKTLYRSPEGTTEVEEGFVQGRPGKVAIKIMHCRSGKELQRRREESSFMIQMKHPNICTCLASFVDALKYYIVMEFSEQGDLEQQIDLRKVSKDPWSENELLTHFTELVDAFSYLQESNLSHGDVKPRNLFISSEGKIKIGDFGESQQGVSAMITRTYQVSGTVIYFSPLVFKAYFDIIKGQNPTGIVRHNPIKSDVYSLGLSFLYMMSLQKPNDLNNLEIGSKNLQGKIDKTIEGLDYSDKMKSILNCMLQVEEHKRYDFLELKVFIRNLKQERQKVDKPGSNNKKIKMFRGPLLTNTAENPGSFTVFELETRNLSTINHTKVHPSSRLLPYNDNTVVITGGLRTPHMALQVDLQTNSTVKLPDMMIGRSSHSIVLWGENILVIGGRSKDKRTALSQCELLKNTEWVEFPTLNIGRENATCVRAKMSLFVAGGSSKSQTRWDLTQTIEKFDDGKWTLLEYSLPQPLVGAGMINVDDSQVLVAGGIGNNGKHTSSCYMWNIESQEFFDFPDLLSEDVFFQNSCTLYQESFVLIGSQRSVLLYKNEWESIKV